MHIMKVRIVFVVSSYLAIKTYCFSLIRVQMNLTPLSVFFHIERSNICDPFFSVIDLGFVIVCRSLASALRGGLRWPRSCHRAGLFRIL